MTLRRQDLTLFHQPIAAQIGANGYTTTISELMFRALTQSDNTCNDAVLRRAGGPEAVRAMLARNRLDGVRFGPGERMMQSQIAGLQWQPDYSVGNAFYAGAQRRADRAAAGGVRATISTIRSTARRRRAWSTASPGCGAANCCRAPRPSGCSRSCRRPAPARSG